MTTGKLRVLVALPFALAALALVQPGAALDNGLARTPPMGFNTWNAFGCGPNLNETTVRGIADALVSTGLRDLGYDTVVVDDCWMQTARDSAGNLVADPARFPSGMKALGDYVHSRGLKFGLYLDAGTLTCNGGAGSFGREKQDARFLAAAGADYVKYDWCHVPFAAFGGQTHDQVAQSLSIRIRDAVAATGRPMVIGLCNGWDAEVHPAGWAPSVGNLWRTAFDVADTWDSFVGEFEANAQFASAAHPGAWNDPDSLQVGNGGMSDVEYRAHMSLWAEMASPLISSTDLRSASPQTLAILGNREVIAIDQDTLGVQGTIISRSGGRIVMSKPLADGSRAVVLFNETSTATLIGTSAAGAGLPAGKPSYLVRDVWLRRTTSTTGNLSATVPAHGAVMYRVSVGGDTLPSQTTLSSGPRPLYAPAGGSSPLTVSLSNDGRQTLYRVSLSLSLPSGWTATPTTATSFAALAPGGVVSATFSVGAPASAQLGAPVTLTAFAVSSSDSTSAPVTAVATTAAPTAAAYLSDLPWLYATAGYGSVQRDRSIVGNPLTVGGTSYAKGLGSHAPSTIEYYLGGRCSSLSVDLGLDDEVGANGSVSFQIWVDGAEIYDSGVVTGSSATQSVTRTVAGANVLDLVVTDGGDGYFYDHADWAGARVVCS